MWTPTADISDADDHQRLAYCSTDLRSLGGHPVAAGRVRTVRCFEDSRLVKEVIEEDGAGRVLVIDGGGSRATALLGEQSTRTALAHHWEGVIVFGSVRDSALLAGLPLHVKALGTIPRRSAKAGRGEVDVPVEFGGVRFEPGAQLWSDSDGLVVATAQVATATGHNGSGDPIRTLPALDMRA